MKLLPTFHSHPRLLCKTTPKQLHAICHHSKEQLLRLINLLDCEILGSDHGSSGNLQQGSSNLFSHYQLQAEEGLDDTFFWHYQ